MSRFLTAPQHNLGHLVPLKVKSEIRESNHKTMLQRLKRRVGKSIRPYYTAYTCLNMYGYIDMFKSLMKCLTLITVNVLLIQKKKFLPPY